MSNTEYLSKDLNFKVHENIVSRKNNNGTIILMCMDEDNLFYKIDGVASEIYSMIETNISYKEILQKVASKYKIEEDIIRKDSSIFISELVRKNILIGY